MLLKLHKFKILKGAEPVKMLINSVEEDNIYLFVRLISFYEAESSN